LAVGGYPELTCRTAGTVAGSLRPDRRADHVRDLGNGTRPRLRAHHRWFAFADAPNAGHVRDLPLFLRHHPGTAQLRGPGTAWRGWAAVGPESHLAYPGLVYCRSSHDNEAWLNRFGAVMDAAILVMSTVEDESEGPARLMFTVGNHLVEDLSWYFRLRSSAEPYVERQEFDEAVARLRKAGHSRRPQEAAWKEFAELRAKYAFPLNQMAQRLAIVPAQWIGDRSYLPHERSMPGRARRRR